MMKTAPLYSFLIFLVGISACSSTGKTASSDVISSLDVSSRELTVTGESIDKGKTYLVYFTLEAPVRCLRVNIVSQYYPNQFAQKMRMAKTYFIVDRLIDLSSFKKNQNSVYVEVGSNFTDSWEQKRDTTICASKTDPLQKLDSGSTYRIRITTFDDYEYQYQILIYSDRRAFLSRTLPEKKEIKDQ